MNWIAILALKDPMRRKRRLAPHLKAVERRLLTDKMCLHVVETLARVPRIGSIELIASAPLAGWSGGWHEDCGRGLNVELEAVLMKVRPCPVLIIHADLPLVAQSDVTALLDAAQEEGMALAPDRHGCGTNAVALHDDRAFRCRFGSNSFVRYSDDAGATPRVVSRMGLALDCDTIDDLELAIALGFAMPHSLKTFINQ